MTCHSEWLVYLHLKLSAFVVWEVLSEYPTVLLNEAKGGAGFKVGPAERLKPEVEVNSTEPISLVG